MKNSKITLRNFLETGVGKEININESIITDILYYGYDIDVAGYRVFLDFPNLRIFEYSRDTERLIRLYYLNQQLISISRTISNTYNDETLKFVFANQIVSNQLFKYILNNLEINEHSQDYKDFDKEIDLIQTEVFYII